MKENKFKNVFTKTVRILTIPPIMATILLLTLYLFKDNIFKNSFELIIAIFTIAIIPVLAYPIQSKFNIYKGTNKRDNQRNLAVIFSVVGYLIGTIYAFLSNAYDLQKVIYLTYLISGVSIFVGTFILKSKFSGHMCGVSGPIITLSYIISWYNLFLYFILGLVFYSSLYLKKHSVKELIIGSIIPVIAFLIAVMII